MKQKQKYNLIGFKKTFLRMLFFVCVFGGGTTMAAEDFHFIERGIIDQVNQEREKNGLNQLEINAKLTEAARLKAQDMINKNYFAHTSPSGKDPWGWLNKVDYDYRFAGENLAMDFSSAVGVHNAWMKSKTHKENILLKDYTEIGVAVAEGIIENQSRKIAVQFFGQPIIQTDSLEKREKKEAEEIKMKGENQIEVKEVTTHIWPSKKENEVLLYAQVVGDPDYVKAEIGKEEIFLQQLQQGKFLSLLNERKVDFKNQEIKIIAKKGETKKVITLDNEEQKKLVENLKKDENDLLALTTISVQGAKNNGEQAKGLAMRNILLAGALLIFLVLIIDVRILEREEEKFLKKMFVACEKYKINFNSNSEELAK